MIEIIKNIAVGSVVMLCMLLVLGIVVNYPILLLVIIGLTGSYIIGIIIREELWK